MDRIERDDPAAEVEFSQQLLGGGDFIRLRVDLDMSDRQRRLGCEGSEDLFGCTVVEGVKASPQNLPVDRQDPALIRRERRRSTQIGGVGPESCLDVGIKPAQDRSDRRVRRWSLPAQAERLVETLQMHPDEGVDAAVGVRSGHDREDREQQDVSLFEAFALGATRIDDHIEPGEDGIECGHYDNLL